MRIRYGYGKDALRMPRPIRGQGILREGTGKGEYSLFCRLYR
jgi:hypothetical protein